MIEEIRCEISERGHLLQYKSNSVGKGDDLDIFLNSKVEGLITKLSPTQERS